MKQDLLKSKLSNKWFVLSVIVLLLNDFVLKQTFNNAFTGKLSDFAGLFAFAYFFSCFFYRYSKAIHYLVAISFVFFKSELATSFISMMNHIFGLNISRVVDYTDYIALPILFFSYHIINTTKEKSISFLFKNSIVAVSVFAFMATSQIPRYGVVYTISDKEFDIKANIQDVTEALNKVEQDRVLEFNKRRLKYHDKPLIYDEERKVYHYDNSPNTVFAYQFESKKLKETDTVKYKSGRYFFYIVADLEKKDRSKIVLKEAYRSLEGGPPENDTIRERITQYPNSVIREFKIDYIRPIKRKL
ncbi:MAG: hypothetical protein LBE34_15065 [Flavobacteriaceae bacterium]|jgi:hypothetical protein|nr:hypothetical protein [Flavobacteriaceae bacterium]